MLRHRIVLCTLALCAAFVGCERRSANTGRNFVRTSDLNRADYTIAGETATLALDIAKEKMNRAKVLEFGYVQDLMGALISRRADALVYDRPFLEYAAAGRDDVVILPDDLAVGRISVATHKSKQPLMDRVNAFIRGYRKDGTYRDMYDRWIRKHDTRMPEIPEVADSKETLVVGVDVAYPPMNFMVEGVPAGFDVEFAKRVARALNMRLELVILPFDGQVAAVQSGRIDLSVCQMDATPERCEQALFSDPYIDAPVSLLIRREDAAASICPSDSGLGETSFLGRFVSGFDKTFIRERRWSMLLNGLGLTLFITFFSMLLGSILSLPLCLACRVRMRWVAVAFRQFVDCVLGTPQVVLLLVMYYIVFTGTPLDAITVAVIAFAIDAAAALSVALGCGIDAVPRGQFEAALALGFPKMRAFCEVVLPQAVRNVVPVYCTQAITTLKATAVVGYIAILDLTKMGDIIRARTYEAFFPVIAVAVIYYLVAKALTALLSLAARSALGDRPTRRTS